MALLSLVTPEPSVAGTGAQQRDAGLHKQKVSPVVSLGERVVMFNEGRSNEEQFTLASVAGLHGLSPSRKMAASGNRESICCVTGGHQSREYHAYCISQRKSVAYRKRQRLGRMICVITLGPRIPPSVQAFPFLASGLVLSSMAVGLPSGPVWPPSIV